MLTKADFLQMMQVRDNKMDLMQAQFTSALQLLHTLTRAPSMAPVSEPKPDVPVQMPQATVRPAGGIMPDSASQYAGMMSEGLVSDRSLHDEVAGQVGTGTHGDSAPIFSVVHQIFEPLEIVGLDTMAAINVLSKSTARALNVLSAKQPSRLQLQGVGKSTSEGVVVAALRVTDDAPWEPTAFDIITGELPTPVQALLSFTWLERHHADLTLRPNQHAGSLVPCRGTTSA